MQQMPDMTMRCDDNVVCDAGETTDRELSTTVRVRIRILSILPGGAVGRAGAGGADARAARWVDGDARALLGA